MAVVSRSPIAPPPGLEMPPPGLEKLGAASSSVSRCRLDLDTLLSESPGSSISAKDAQPRGLLSSCGHSFLCGSPIRLPHDSKVSLPLAFDEPAYIRLGDCPSPVSTSAGDALSEASLSSHSQKSVLENAWLHSQDPAGSRRVQDALDEASDEMMNVVLQEFHGRSVKAMRDPHANHVLQKCISLMTPTSLQFMVDELLERDGLATAVARHRYGCRIVQQLLKKCSASQVSGLAEALMQEIVTLACHSFGNFSVQHLLQFGTEEQRHQIAQTIVTNAGTICRSRAGDGVVATALEHTSSQDKGFLVQAVLHEQGLLVELAQGRHSHSAVLRMLQVLDGQASLQAHMSLAMEITTLRASRYGRVVAKHLEEKSLHMAVQ
eukprot:CAMPEP_0115287434 /NCGR_PEP_ID=MMETSP0270-20121206/62456_1 /TAXON_ID=71861 /ORGANISM="Scrippsiella trochoidea, Strain CCMP3099" /LENGTH=377 /DNA_ID=CAMNT_0002704511 /DNA_START=30 /DNA_END=1163 /DNA_ORIENTATION=+